MYKLIKYDEVCYLHIQIRLKLKMRVNTLKLKNN